MIITLSQFHAILICIVVIAIVFVNPVTGGKIIQLHLCYKNLLRSVNIVDHIVPTWWQWWQGWTWTMKIIDAFSKHFYFRLLFFFFFLTYIEQQQCQTGSHNILQFTSCVCMVLYIYYFLPFFLYAPVLFSIHAVWRDTFWVIWVKLNCGWVVVMLHKHELWMY